LYSALADVKMLQFNSSELVTNILRMALSNICQKAKTIVVLVAVHSDPSSDGSPTWIQATLRFELHLELARCIRKNDNNHSDIV
jgi:hypothetical protein